MTSQGAVEYRANGTLGCGDGLPSKAAIAFPFSLDIIPQAD